MHERKEGLSQMAGRISVATIATSALLFAFFYFVSGQQAVEHVNAADTATTSVTVVNTPPNWTVDAEEEFESSVGDPTNAGDVISWVATGTDSNAEDYFLLICKSSTTPTANANARPSCGGGFSNQWAVSATTTSGAKATAATTTYAVLGEQNLWVAWICDANPVSPKCNLTYKEGTGGTASPFVVNHRPTFTVFLDNSPTLPGAVATFYSTSSDPDSYGGQDSVQIFVCKANDFTGTECGVGGTWGTSTLYASDPSASTTISVSPPTQDGNYSAYGFVIDNHGFAASGGAQGTDSTLTVDNATPSISAATVSLNDTDGAGSLTLLTHSGTTTGFYVDFTVTDNNSCVANASTTNELSSGRISVYRSGVTQASCQVSGDYSAPSCYPYGVATTTWNPTCVQVSGSCSGPDDPTAVWRCTFPLWYVADPTDGADLTDSTWFAENWLASAQIIDDDYATSTLVEGTSGNELASFLGYDLDATSIAYGSLEPGQQTDPVVQNTPFLATGNVGLDQTLYGADMCPGYPVCSGNATSTIFATSQVYATSSVAYAAATALGYNPGAELELNVPKSTSTAAEASRDTFWGIDIPSAITLAGDYIGVNTFIGVKGEAQQW